MKTIPFVKKLGLLLLLTASSLFAQTAPNPSPGAAGALVSDQANTISSTERDAALAEATAGRAKGVEKILVALSEREPIDVDACLQLARLRMQEGDTKEAVGLLERVTIAVPNRSDLQSEFGSALSRRIGQVNFIQQGMIAGKMHAAFEKAVALDPKNIGGWIGLAQYCANAPAIAGGSMEKAESYAKEVEKLDAYQGAVQFGLIAAKRGDLTRAESEFKRAAELRPTDSSPYVELGYAYLRANRPAEAKDAFEAALSRDPARGSASKGLARAIEQLSKPKS